MTPSDAAKTWLRNNMAKDAFDQNGPNFQSELRKAYYRVWVAQDIDRRTEWIRSSNEMDDVPALVIDNGSCKCLVLRSLINDYAMLFLV